MTKETDEDGEWDVEVQPSGAIVKYLTAPSITFKNKQKAWKDKADSDIKTAVL